MKKNVLCNEYIYITFEGFTFQPNSESDVSVIENMQAVGFACAKDKKEAFENLLINSSYLKDTVFNEIIALEFLNREEDVFTI